MSISIKIRVFFYYPKPTSRHIMTMKPTTVPHVASNPFPLEKKIKE